MSLSSDHYDGKVGMGSGIKYPSEGRQCPGNEYWWVQGPSAFSCPFLSSLTALITLSAFDLAAGKPHEACFLVLPCAGESGKWVRICIRLLLFLFSHSSCPALCHRMDCNMPGFPVLHYFPDFAQTHVCCVNDAIQPSYLMSVKE